MELIRYQKNRMRFRDVILEGIAQLENYRSWFEDKMNRDNFYSKYGLSAYKAKIVLIIGRRDSYYAEVDRLKLESGLPNYVDLKTYDDVIAKARQWRSFVTGGINAT